MWFVCVCGGKFFINNCLPLHAKIQIYMTFSVTLQRIFTEKRVLQRSNDLFVASIPQRHDSTTKNHLTQCSNISM